MHAVGLLLKRVSEMTGWTVKAAPLPKDPTSSCPDPLAISLPWRQSLAIAHRSGLRFHNAVDARTVLALLPRDVTRVRGYTHGVRQQPVSAANSLRLASSSRSKTAMTRPALTRLWALVASRPVALVLKWSRITSGTLVLRQKLGRTDPSRSYPGVSRQGDEEILTLGGTGEQHWPSIGECDETEPRNKLASEVEIDEHG